MAWSNEARQKMSEMRNGKTQFNRIQWEILFKYITGGVYCGNLDCAGI